MAPEPNDTHEHQPEESCDLLIVGAGLAGMNALFAATRYLTSSDRVILVDRRERPGGMWHDAYPYVRLHQPYPLFTAGNIAWTLNRERDYLATRGEVLDHFEHCLDVLKQQARVDDYFGWTLESAEESPGLVRACLRNQSGATVTVRTPKVIKAYGFNIDANDPLPVSSSAVRSVSPNHWDITGEDMRADDSPVWIIGSGKTGMDTAAALLDAHPAREVNMLAGTGTYFISRERLYPSGPRRWWGGTTASAAIRDACRRYDGTNENDLNAWHRTRYGVTPIPDATRNMYGMLSARESTRITNGLTRIVRDYLDDATDHGNDVDLVLRSGSTITVPAGTWIVNCTGHIARKFRSYEPYRSAGGRILSLNDRSAFMHLSSFGGYFGTHLLYLNALGTVPLYELDAPDARSKMPASVPYVIGSLAFHNISLIADAVPSKVFLEAGMDPDRWYPMPRQLLSTARFMITHRRDREHYRRTLDTLRTRYGIRCGPLPVAEVAAEVT